VFEVLYVAYILLETLMTTITANNSY